MLAPSSLGRQKQSSPAFETGCKFWRDTNDVLVYQIARCPLPQWYISMPPVRTRRIIAFAFGAAL